MKRITLPFLLFFSLVSGITVSKANYFSGPVLPDTNGLRSDTIDILNYTINLNITDFVTDTISGNTLIRFTPKMNNIKTLSLDLLHFTIDSVIMSAAHLGFSYNDTLMIITLHVTENIGDTNNITVFYHGKPLTDPSEGGFYFEPPYAFNMGEAVSYCPQTIGRSWYPCIDNFRARALYTFNITTDSGKIAYCNGYLFKDTTAGKYRTRTWIINHTLAPYLASVDVAPYIQVNDTFKGSDTIPIVIAAIKSDSSKIGPAFINLKKIIGIFQNCFGTYPWNKVGYTEVGNKGLDIEHATNIAIPSADFAATLNDEITFAHELSHQWFGDKVTCWAASDMWLNEGFATYFQFLYQAYLYNNVTCDTNLDAYQEYMLQFAYLNDKGYRALSGMPRYYTFGNTTYLKGEAVVATLRGYLGDSNFFNGLKYYLNSHPYQPVTPDTLKNSLERYSGMNLTDFFNDWVYAPGYPQFSVDSFTIVPAGPNYAVTVYIKQKLSHAPAYYNNVPLQVTFKSGISTGTSGTIIASGQHSSSSFILPFKPVFVGLNLNGAIRGDAIAPDSLVIPKNGTWNFTNAHVYNVTISSIIDTAFLYVEHNFVAPDQLKDTALHYRLSPNHYWKISGIYPPSLFTKATLYFDGNKILSGIGYMDTALTIYTRDSLLLLYRKNAANDWKEFAGYTKSYIGPGTDMHGYFTLDSLPQGEYVFANGVSHVLGINENILATESMDVYPNPASGSFTVNFTPAMEDEYLCIYNIEGKLIKQQPINTGQKSCFINSGKWGNGVYLVSLRNKNKELCTQQVIIAH